MTREHSQDSSTRLQTGDLRASFRLLHGHLDGAFGPATATAIRESQRSQGHGEVGSADAALDRAGDHAKTAETAETAARPARTTASPLDVLHSTSASDSAYQQAIAAWPEDQPIWPQLLTLAAREELVRYIARHNDTRSRAYLSSVNRCTGSAVQVYGRFSTRAALDPAYRATLAAGAIDGVPAAGKLRVPAFVVVSGEFAFCAFLIDETAPDELGSYRLFEPQTDGFITPRTSAWETHVERFGVVLCDVVGCDAQGRFDLRPVRGFVADHQRQMTRVLGVGIVRFLCDLSVAESGASNYDLCVGKGGGFVPFVRRQAREVWRLGDAELIEAGRLVIGRSLRSHPARRFTVLTADDYVALIGRPDLRASLPGAVVPVQPDQLSRL